MLAWGASGREFNSLQPDINDRRSTMMDNSNARRTVLLGLPFGTAQNKLRKSLLFEFARRLGLLGCYRCNGPIESIEVFSIEHKKSWMMSDNPQETFYDLDNIAFSHIRCNVAAAYQPNKKYSSAK